MKQSSYSLHTRFPDKPAVQITSSRTSLVEIKETPVQLIPSELSSYLMEVSRANFISK
jgi:hypothetical protein